MLDNMPLWQIGLATIVLIVANIYLLFFLVFALAKNNWFFTLVEEGQAKGITSFGRAYRCVMSFNDHCFAGELPGSELSKEDEEYWRVEKREGDQRSSRTRTFISKLPGIDAGGLYWVGIPPFRSVYKYKFKWTSARGELPADYDEEGVSHYQTRVEIVDKVLVRQETYSLEIKGVEDQNLIPVDMKVVWTGQIINPFKALFRVQEWLETSSNRLLAYLLREFGNKSWREFQDLHYKEGGEEDEKSLEELLQVVLAEIKSDYGFKTIGIEISEFKPPDTFAEAALAVREAEADAEASVHNATAIKNRAKAESERIRMVGEATEKYGREGVVMKVVEDLSRGENTTILLPGGIVESLKKFVSN